MNYRSVADLNNAILDWIPRLPRDLDLIVGIPRSGLLAANLLALHLNLPLTDVDGLMAGRILSAGERCSLPDRDVFFQQPRHVLLLDDSLLQGSQMAHARDRVRPLAGRHRLRFGVVYLQPGQEHQVDFFCEPLEKPRLFEWHLLHHGNLRHWCMDIDGVLCADPTEQQNDDGEKYLQFLRTVEPRIIPSKEIGWLVTCRLERYRHETEEWLARNGVRFRHLVMMDYPSAAARRVAGNYVAFKAKVYRESGAPLFIESSRSQAAEISFRTGKCVFCFETREMIRPGIVPQVRHQPGSILNRLLQTQRVEIKKALGLFSRG